VRALVQRVSEARVEVDGAVVGAIGTGLLVLVGVSHEDTVAVAEAVARKVYGLRILGGRHGVGSERSLADDPDFAVLVVSQFTLYGDARKGRRPTWAAAAPGPVAEPLVDAVSDTMRSLGVHVETGVFGADMRVQLVNEGPMTLLIEM
jgi:D-tyrosyl-tRNA(Tyr) deacylase